MCTCVLAVILKQNILIIIIVYLSYGAIFYFLFCIDLILDLLYLLIEKIIFVCLLAQEP